MARPHPGSAALPKAARRPLRSRAGALPRGHFDRAAMPMTIASGCGQLTWLRLGVKVKVRARARARIRVRGRGRGRGGGVG